MISGAILVSESATKKLALSDQEIIMAIMKGGGYVQGKPKKTRQGSSQNTLYAATSRNKAKKAYRGQGKQVKIY